MNDLLGVDIDKMESVEQIAAAIKGDVREMNRTARTALLHAIRVGLLLKRAKGMIEHGQWGVWVVGNLDFSERTAQAYMRLADHGDEILQTKPQNSAVLTIESALKLIAEPKPAAPEPRRCPKCGAKMAQADTHENCPLCRCEKGLAAAGAKPMTVQPNMPRTDRDDPEPQARGNGAGAPAPRPEAARPAVTAESWAAEAEHVREMVGAIAADGWEFVSRETVADLAGFLIEATGGIHA